MQDTKSSSSSSSSVLALLEQTFWEDGTYPSIETIQTKVIMPGPEIRKLVRSPEFTELLAQRGLAPYENLPKLKGSSFTPLQVLSVTIIADYHDKRSVSQKLKAIGVTTRTYQAWLRDSRYLAFLQQEIDRRFNSSVAIDAKLSLSKLVTDGDLSAIKYYHEVTGVYRPNSETAINLGLIIAQMMEILVEYLAPEQLARVADRLEGVLEVQEKPQPNKPQELTQPGAVGNKLNPDPGEFDSDAALDQIIGAG